ncbi:sulfur carrier protein ThiS adenylyltransferase ThiF [Desulfosarcina sp.]|uniref:sulfur carrier protein ThiS adenylyltransferase ThiF n=1 Tax=Desulfosarcina sp. TaxID=2027861 RepID=UPI0035693637
MAANPFLKGLQAHFTDEQIRRLGSGCVGIAGAGGLGSNAAAHLVRSGIRRLVVADFDHVAPSNLNRQYYFIDQVGMKKVTALEANLKRINPDLDVHALDLRLSAGNVGKVFRHCHMIVEALDRAQDKKMMAEAFLADSRLLVSASGIGGWGRSDRIRTRRVRDGFYLVGDGCSEVSDTMPPTSAVVGIAAAKQADVVVERILNERVRGFEGSRIQASGPATR